jgi:hyaluronan synthase
MPGPGNRPAEQEGWSTQMSVPARIEGMPGHPAGSVLSGPAHPISAFRRIGTLPWVQVVLLFTAVAAGVLAFTLDLGPSRMSIARDLLGPTLPWVLWPGTVMGLLVMVSTTWRVALWLGYRAAPADADRDLPAVTVLVPAFNEGARTRDCLRSILASDYPADRLKVVAVDDGSGDDTLAWLRAAAAEAPDRVTVIAFPRNRGKRHALCGAFTHVQSPVVVTVDSDTVLPPASLRALVTPLRNPGLGAVAGRIEVLNRDGNLLTRMLGVRYRYGFDFVRASQSRLRSVFVCPGAFTAYRTDAIREYLPAWQDERFLGRECRNGDDHALTNHILSSGLGTVYQSTAVAHTRVPETYMGLSRMYLRWARSNVRESLRYLSFAPRLLARPRNWPAVIDAMTLILQIPLRLYLLPLSWIAVVVSPGVLIPAIAGALSLSLLPVAAVARSERSLEACWGVLYAIFSLLTLQWIYPVAAFTVRSNRWLTR